MGKRVYHLNIGQPDIPTPKAFLDGITKADIQVLSYSSSQGMDGAVRALIRYYHTLGINLTKEEIVVTIGGSEAILFSMLAVLDPGDEVIVPEPFYPNYRGYAVLAGLDIVPVTTKLEEGFQIPGKEALENIISEKTRAILITNPDNPTGVVYSHKELDTLREIALKYDLFLIVDEVYREFLYEEGDHISVLQLEGLEQQAILVDSISKRFSVCGARIGCLASRNKQIMKSVLKMAQARLSPPTAGQLGMINFLNSPQYPCEVDKMIDKYRDRRDLVYKRLNEMDQVTCSKPPGAFYIVCKLPVEDSTHFAHWLLTDFSLNEETVMLAPLAGFYATEKLGKDEVRISYVLNRKSLNRSMDILENALKSYRTEEKSKVSKAIRI